MTKKELDNYLDTLPVPSADLTVWLDHKEIYRHTSGHFDKEKTTPITGEEHYFLYSASKITTCTAALMLYERGLIGIDDPVSKYLPEYADLTVEENGSIRPAKTTLTIRHLFTMTGGLDYVLERDEIKEAIAIGGGDASTREIVRAIAKKPLLFDPGTHFNYSLCHDVLAAVIEVASGMSFGEFLRKNIWEPLGMKETTVKRPSSELLTKIPDQYTAVDGTIKNMDKSCCYQLSDSYESGGAGIISTPNDYILFIDALASGGVSKNGVHILKKESIDLMRTPQLSETALEDFKENCSNKPGYSYAFGVRTHIDKEASRLKSPIGEFGWDGAAGAYVLIDVEKKLSILYFQHVIRHSYAYDVIHPTIANAVYDYLEEENKL